MTRFLARAFVVLTLLLSVVPAQASSVLFMGQDPNVDFIGIGTLSRSNDGYLTTSGYYQVHPVCVGNGTSTSDPPANRLQTPTFTASGALWIHAQLKGGSASTANEQTLLLRSPDGVARILLRQTSTFGIFKLSTRNSAGTITDVATASTPALAATTITAFDLHIDYAGGAAQLYLAGTQVINFSGTLETDSATTLNQAEFMAADNKTAGCSGASTPPYPDFGTSTWTSWSQVMITDTQDTRGMVLMDLTPQANGTTQNCTGSAGNLTDNLYTTVESSSSNNQLCGFTTALTFPAGTWSVLAVGQSAVMARGTSGPQNFDWYTRVNSTDNLAGQTNNPGTSSTWFSRIWQTNPNTSAAWATGDIASGFNLGIKSLP